MPNLTRRFAVLGLAGLGLAPILGQRADAAPILYELDQAETRVGFRFALNGIAQTGTMPIEQAVIVIDPRNLSRSRVDVTLRVAGARTGFIFATQALVGAEVLDAARYPTIRFVTDRVQLADDGRLSGGARITGQLTMRDVTRPLTLSANLFRPPGTAPDDLSRLRVQLSGQVSRSAFGASGFAALVDDIVGLDITAVIRAVT